MRCCHHGLTMPRQAKRSATKRNATSERVGKSIPRQLTAMFSQPPVDGRRRCFHAQGLGVVANFQVGTKLRHGRQCVRQPSLRHHPHQRTWISMVSSLPPSQQHVSTATQAQAEGSQVTFCIASRHQRTWKTIGHHGKATLIASPQQSGNLLCHITLSEDVDK